MIVCCDRYDQFQQVPCGDFPREGLTFQEKDLFSERRIDLEAHWRKLPASPAESCADQNEHQRRKICFEGMNECMKKHGKS